VACASGKTPVGYKPWASKTISEKRPKSAGVVRSIARSFHVELSY
jgi:hypothetical protein